MPVQQVRDDFARRLGRALEDGSFQMLRLAHASRTCQRLMNHLM